MADKQPTQKEMFTRIMELVEDQEVIEFCERKLAQLDKPRKVKFNKEANDFALEVIDVLQSADEPMTNKEIVAAMNERFPELEKPISAQKVAAALKKIAEGKVMEHDDETVPFAVKLTVIEPEKASGVKTFSIA